MKNKKIEISKNTIDQLREEIYWEIIDRLYDTSVGSLIVRNRQVHKEVISTITDILKEFLNIRAIETTEVQNTRYGSKVGN